MKQKYIDWLNKGDGGYTPYEPYITNRDIISLMAGTFFICGIIIFGCYFTNR